MHISVLFFCGTVASADVCRNNMCVQGVLWTAFALTHNETAALVAVARESTLGTNRPKDLNRAFKFYKRAAEKGSGRAQMEALYELSNLEMQTPGEDFALLSK